jgi:L-lysine 2,3-aminomutase
VQGIRTKSARTPVQLPILRVPAQLADLCPTLSPERLRRASIVAEAFEFRVPRFYVTHVLSGDPRDPLLDLVLPSEEEFLDGPEEWDAAAHCYQASDSPFWIQKYQYQGLLRLTTHCSGLCRYCYLKRKNTHTRVMRPADVDIVFDALEARGGDLHDIILSGGDPLCAPPTTLMRIADRITALRRSRGTNTPFISIHTREPVWNPVALVANHRLFAALRQLAPSFYMLHVLHRREVTPQFQEACEYLSSAASPNRRPSLLCQHPVFRGVNDSVEVLEELYAALLACTTPILPYYMVYPFFNGTLPHHRITLEHLQSINRELARRPGVFAPKLVVPTPRGKCIVGPNDPIVVENGAYRLTTKDGEVVYLSSWQA